VLGAWASALDTIKTVGGTAKANVASPRMEKSFRRERISVSPFSLMSRSPLSIFCGRCPEAAHLATVRPKRGDKDMNGS
jgi:hypothetical protein